ncbi:Fe-S cluster assembly sulfur transfer protein SufU [Mycoplasma zalophi]|uniref:SUF system NifU family Fe-S cluster assembly protein n=1 Tax=Mycoplasma zalophi TaxID=191287 RepID=A0ABS6DRA3_9MOLU|nr:SUF system NifU family Fe-S cluster assembly protein [Mycoplasma zalophi]MBU4691322.1 SUF system NifU family Fe-S cluster assembly protein [Mycoplasma zalophi]MBU4692472.1 SUF system NifU family Fe-S cluster assembly protein [Mycoplasma zalophi]
MTTYSNLEKREIIYSHYEKPNNFSEYKDAKSILDHSNTGCADNLVLNVEVENNILKNATFNGIGCSIFMAASDIMIDILKNKTINEIKLIINEYENMIFNSKINNPDILGDLIIFENVRVHMNRVECATIISRSFKKALNIE